MNKGELVVKVAEVTGLSKKDSEAAINAFVETIQNSLKGGEKVAIAGFGTFDVSNRKARTGRNPQTGEEIKIAASKNPKFKAGKSFKEMIN
ncbi:MAG: HU family DNA-binding protein [Lachnospiraceae bacterium]|nr:HU family DNA-binding protein [Lachnospiraceae bacterium]